MDNSTKGLETQKTGDRYDEGEEIDRLKAELEREKYWKETYYGLAEQMREMLDQMGDKNASLRATSARLRFAVLLAFGWACAEKGAKCQS